MEVSVATWLLRHSVPDLARRTANPIGRDSADITAGEDLFAQKCAACHAYDGSGKTEIGSGEYPRPPALRSAASAMTDGEIFYHIRNGIRNTAMPAWNMPDRQIWQLVAYIRHLAARGDARARQIEGPVIRLRTIWAQLLARAATRKSMRGGARLAWPMSCAIPRSIPTRSFPISPSHPLLTFTKEDVAFVYGSAWKQRYFRKVGDDYFPLPAQWDVTTKKWSNYHVAATGSDWWAQYYPDPGDNSARPTGPFCDGCHSVNYNIATKTPTEWNVGCERCHGAGQRMSRTQPRQYPQSRAQDYVHANDTCIQCHSQGRPLNNPINGKYYDWPVGFHVGSEPVRLLETGRAQAGRTDLHPLSRTARHTRTACRATISFRA